MPKSKTKLVPRRCKKIKHDITKDTKLKKRAAKDGGGEIPVQKIKKNETWECEMEAVPNYTDEAPKVVRKPADWNKKRERHLPDGAKELKTLSVGIAEKKKEKKTKNPCGSVGNPTHSAETGRFTSTDDEDYCRSLWNACPSGGRRRGKKGSKSTTWIKKPHQAGRHTKDNPRKWKCGKNEPLEETEGISKDTKGSYKIKIKINRKRKITNHAKKPSPMEG